MKQRKRFLFATVVNKWNAKNALMTRQGKRFAQTMVVNATIGIGASMMAGSGMSAWADDSSSLPEVVVTGQQEQASPYKPEAVSSSKYTEPLRDVPQTITVVPQAVMEEQGATTLRDVLRNVPGISIQAGEGGVPAGDNLSIRGFNARTDMFIDGVRDFGGYSRDSFNFEQIEVVKGPASSYAGRGSTGGSVNMVSKEPKPEAFEKGTVGIGTDSYKRATLDVNEPLEGIQGSAVRLNALWHEADAPGRDVAENSRWGLAPSMVFGLETPTRTVISYFHLDQDNVPDYGIPWVPVDNIPLAAYRDKPVPVDYSNFYGLKARDYEKTKTDVATAKLEHDFSESVSVRNLLRYGRTNRDSIITAPRFNLPTSTDIRRTDWKTRDQKDTMLNGQTDLTLRFETGEVGHTVVSGMELSRETEDVFSRVDKGPLPPVTDLYHPNPNDPFVGPIVRNGEKADATAKAVALYVFDTLKLSERWDVNGGLRWDRLDVDSQLAPSATLLHPLPLSRSDDMLSWKAGAVFKPVEYGSVYFGLGTSFNPSAEGLTLASTATAANSVDLDPEKNRSFELGTKWDLFEEKLALGAALFRTDKTNARTEDPLNPLDVIALDGKQRVDGLELSASGNVTEQWSVFAALTHMKSEILDSRNRSEVGNELGNTPENSFNLWTTYQLSEKIQAGLGAQFVDDRFNNNANARIAPSYQLFDAMGSYEVNENLTLRLNVYNLADEEYLDRVGGGHVIPGATRSATLTASLKM